MTAEQIDFICRFVNRDLNQTREGDWLNLQDDIRQFFGRPGGVEIASQGMIRLDPSGDPEYGKYPKLKLVTLQKDLRDLLAAKTAREPHAIVMTGTIPVTINWSFQTDASVAEGANWLVGTGKVRDLFLQIVINLFLDRPSSFRIRRCPECGRAFLRIRRQVYCAKPCVDAANKRHWLTTDKGKRYLKKLKKRRRVRK